MKKILSIILLVCSSYLLRAQFSITQNLGSPSTLVKNPNYGGFQGGLIPFTFADTTAANLTNLKYYSGALIYTSSPRAVFWRDASVSQWLQLLPSGGSTGTLAWVMGGNNPVVSDGSGNAILGPQTNNGIAFLSNNLQRLILPAAGLTFNQLASDTTLNKVLTYNTSTKAIGYGYWYGGSGATPDWQTVLTAGSTLTSANTIVSNALTQTFTFNSLAGASGFKLSTNSVNAASDAQRLFEVSMSGANSNAGEITYGAYISNNHTGSNSDNIGVYTSSNNGTNNYGIQSSTSGGTNGIAGTFQAIGSGTLNKGIDITVQDGTSNIGGMVNISSTGANTGLILSVSGGTTNKSLDITSGIVEIGEAGIETGQIDIKGVTSGVVSIKPQDAAGTFNFNLPTTAGTSGYFLTSAGGGASAMTWTNPASITPSLTATYLGYGSGSNTLTGSANNTWTAATNIQTIDSGIIKFTGSATFGDAGTGSIFKSSTYGLATRAVSGSFSDWLLFGTSGNSILANHAGTDDFATSGKFGAGLIGGSITAIMHLKAGTTAASTAPLKFNSGSLMTTAEAGAVEFLTDKWYATITTGAARKELTLNDAALTSGRVPYVTTNGRLTDNSNFTFDGSSFSLTANGALDALSTGLTTLGDYNNATGIQISGSNSSDVMTYKSATTHTFSTGTVTMSAYGAGTATFDASGNITSVSDMRLKDLQGMYEVGINRILQINPIVYKWNEKSKLERNHNYIGFSAQNVKDALGENAIGVNKEGYYSLQDRALLAAVVNGEKDLYKIIQEQQKQIDELKKDIKRLKK